MISPIEADTPVWVAASVGEGEETASRCGRPAQQTFSSPEELETLILREPLDLLWIGSDRPDLIAFLPQLRATVAGAAPVVIVVAKERRESESTAPPPGADYYLRAEEACAPAWREVWERALGRMEANPLTGLPGRARLDREVRRRLEESGPWALLALDIRHFKAFNDRYGYNQGDRMLLLVRELLLQATEETAAEGDLALHLGGDDFFLFTAPERAEAQVERLQEQFSRRSAELYEPRDREAGGIITFTRQGEHQFVPLAHLTAVGVSNRAEDLGHPGQFAAVLAELKEYARREEKREIVWDRRLVHDARRAWAQRRRNPQGGR
jgi:diguanylate cyclase (GGDEF)-like protein